MKRKDPLPVKRLGDGSLQKGKIFMSDSLEIMMDQGFGPEHRMDADEEYRQLCIYHSPVATPEQKKQAKLKLVASLFGLVLRLASMVAARHSDSDIDDLVQDGLIAVCQSIDHYDTKTGYRISTLAWRNILWKLRSSMCNLSTIRLTQSAIKNLPVDKRHILQNPIDIDSLDTSSRDWLELKASDDVESDQLASETEIASRVQRAIDRLPQRYKEVVRMRMAGKTLQEVGEVYGITRERVRQIEAKGYSKLKCDPELQELVR